MKPFINTFQSAPFFPPKRSSLLPSTGRVAYFNWKSIEFPSCTRVSLDVQQSKDHWRHLMGIWGYLGHFRVCWGWEFQGSKNRPKEAQIHENSLNWRIMNVFNSSALLYHRKLHSFTLQEALIWFCVDFQNFWGHLGLGHFFDFLLMNKKWHPRWRHGCHGNQPRNNFWIGNKIYIL